MNERQWVEKIARHLRSTALGRSRSIRIETGVRLAYSYEIDSYPQSSSPRRADFETDLAIVEDIGTDAWIPRVVVEAKIKSVTTHDAITYSHKAAVHRAVHPYLRYGVMVGDRKGYPLPGRLYRHGAQFDFMASFRSTRPSAAELSRFTRILRLEITASRTLERILYQSRKRDRDRYTFLHRRLVIG